MCAVDVNGERVQALFAGDGAQAAQHMLFPQMLFTRSIALPRPAVCGCGVPGTESAFVVVLQGGRVMRLSTTCGRFGKTPESQPSVAPEGSDPSRLPPLRAQKTTRQPARPRAMSSST